MRGYSQAETHIYLPLITSIVIVVMCPVSPLHTTHTHAHHELSRGFLGATSEVFKNNFSILSCWPSCLGALLSPLLLRLFPVRSLFCWLWLLSQCVTITDAAVEGRGLPSHAQHSGNPIVSLTKTPLKAWGLQKYATESNVPLLSK